MGDLCMPRPVLRLSEKGIKLKEVLRSLMYIHIAISFVMMIFLGLLDGIFELIAPAILYCGINQNNYCSILIYFILNTMGIVFKFSYLVQIWNMFGFADSFQIVPATNIILLLIIAFYLTADIFTLQAYQEFKACAEPHHVGEGRDYEANQELSSFGGRVGGGPIGGYQPPQPQTNNVRQPAGNSNFHAFRGQGVRLGGT
ncbi:unnamed protein product [Moneuplotes crassus]|uniref:Uncharacterized protein n=1 Tax=Euplotes crassus TaxID=5936 RepID=A0AAD2D4M6_EUPCR|nr:unnamed protein product [Moneuplotes crassus]